MSAASIASVDKELDFLCEEMSYAYMDLPELVEIEDP